MARARIHVTQDVVIVVFSKHGDLYCTVVVTVAMEIDILPRRRVATVANSNQLKRRARSLFGDLRFPRMMCVCWKYVCRRIFGTCIRTGLVKLLLCQIQLALRERKRAK